MDSKITTYSTLLNLVDIDIKDHKLKDIATLFLKAMNDWPTYNQNDIAGFLKELKEYFGSPLIVEKIENRKFDGLNAWQVEAGNSIVKLIGISSRFYSLNEFDKIIENVLNYYNDEFSKVDFIAELHYLTTEQGGRKTPVFSGYRPQVKFDIAEMQTSGQQTFIDKETVFPGEHVNAKIKIVSTDYLAECLKEGMLFDFREGSRVIGSGKIIKIINDKLECSSN